MSRRKRTLFQFLLICLLILNGIVYGSLWYLKQSENVEIPVTINKEEFSGEWYSPSAGQELPEFPVPVEKSSEELLAEQVEKQLNEMPLDEKILQMFFITPEALTGFETVTAAGNTTEQAIQQYPVGGLVYFAQNLQNPDQTKEMLENTKHFYEELGKQQPFLAVDEEGGSVTRIGNNPGFSVAKIDDMSSLGERGDLEEASQTGHTIGRYLADLGFNLDFAPVADVLTNSENTVVKKRSFGSDPRRVSDMALAVAESLEAEGIHAVMKHFPGHGATAADTHAGYAYTEKTLEELFEEELVPFQEGIQSGITLIMVAHISVPEITGDDTPCSLSEYMITEVLREKMGYDGIVVTDAMNMGAINNQYSSSEAVVKAVQAGADMILTPANFTEAFNGVKTAVDNGNITEERINESVRRILKVKLKS